MTEETAGFDKKPDVPADVGEQAAAGQAASDKEAAPGRRPPGTRRPPRALRAM
ncbi:hypothetical protein G3260_003702 [Streptomyces albus]|uniref:hypothetical protein n=1 Tax=Streptomyces albus TaxID=1888 RepID=UPI0013B49616|nr:hypothetical protein [Streptomyces albus]QID37306.1 hypothetical protein G3260_003702 [Streptomyces albus]